MAATKKFLAAGRTGGQPPKHRELSYVREGIGDRPLKQLLDRGMKRLAGSEIGIEDLQSGKESLLLARPIEGLGVAPALAPLDDAEGPVKKVAHVGEDLRGLAAGAIEGRKRFRRVLKGACCAVGQRSNGVAKECAFFVHERHYSATAGRRTD